MAAACLADHPFHAEQPRLRLALGRLHMAQGFGGKAAKALEEGLQLLSQKGAGAGHRDQVALLLELGRIQGQRAQFQHALATLNAAKRFLEHEGDRPRLAGVLSALGQVHQGLGQMAAAYQYLNEALGLARTLDDQELKAGGHLAMGILRSCQQLLGPALSHIDSALRRYQAMGDRPMAARALAWKARTIAALGDGVQAEFLLLRASEFPQELTTPLEAGDLVFLGGEIAAFRESWRDAKRLYLEAANRFFEAGCVWRERLARLRCIQAETCEAGTRGPESAWVHLERLKGPVEGTGSRWLELEWHKAHALLLSRSGPEETVVSEALLAWGEVLALARELDFPALVLEAEASSSALLLARGEKLGARSRVQDALPSFQDLWSKLPDTFEQHFLGRPDLLAFRRAVEDTGLRFILPVKVDPLADWSPTQANLQTSPSSR
jgi:tetratricopeptide (TPR) repeat protein